VWPLAGDRTRALAWLGRGADKAETSSRAAEEVAGWPKALVALAHGQVRPGGAWEWREPSSADPGISAQRFR